MEWLRQGDTLFRWGAGCRFNACIDPYGHTLYHIATCYKDAADALARTAAPNTSDLFLDRAILPIVFLYRQHIELLLKDIIDIARRIEGEGSGYPKNHNLKNLWDNAIRLLRQHYGQDTPKELDYVQACVDEFQHHDPGSMAFRYPTDRDGLPNLRDLMHIDLRNLYEVMDRLSCLLSCIAGDLGNKLASMSEPM
jgi:hypothetical protein